MLNFTNPEARVLHAIGHLTKVKAAGLCHGVFTGLQAISHYLRMPLEELDIITAGMNHFYAALKVGHRKSGEDLLGVLLQRVLNDPIAKELPLFRKFAEIFDVFIFPSDDHTGEYVSFGSEYLGIKWKYGQEHRQVPLEEPPSTGASLEDYATGKVPLTDDYLLASCEMAVPVVCDVEFNRGRFRPAVNVINTEGYIENLPRNAAIEVPAIVDAQGIHPLKVGSLPEPFAAFIRTQCTIHDLVTEAYRTRSKKLLLQALLLDPVVNGITAAEKMLDEMLELQKEYIPTFE